MSQFDTGNAGFPLSASNVVPRSRERERVVEDRVRVVGAKNSFAERAGVRCRDFGFNGPIMVEGIKVGATAEETTADARAHRQLLEKALASI
ncbi:MAG: hypothetical protein AAB466_14285 [Verrucomicrobiota bacterium]